MIGVYIILASRIVVFTIFVIAAAVAGTYWLVKQGHLSPFGALPRAMRQLGQPFVKPLERKLLKSGGNPVNAPYALFLVALLGGLAFLAIVQWAVGAVYLLLASSTAGPMAVFRLLVSGVFFVLMAAIFIRVIASWFSISPYSKPMRLIYGLTNWLIEPLRKVIPPLGMFDMSPLVAYLMLYLARWLLLG
jgi:YggT family protein